MVSNKLKSVSSSSSSVTYMFKQVQSPAAVFNAQVNHGQLQIHPPSNSNKTSSYIFHIPDKFCPMMMRLGGCDRQHLLTNIHSDNVMVVKNCQKKSFCTDASPPHAPKEGGDQVPNPKVVSFCYTYGLIQTIIPLPSRNQRCLITLKPHSNSVADLFDMIRSEDLGVDRLQMNKVSISSADDGNRRDDSSLVRIASSTSIQTLMETTTSTSSSTSEQILELMINDEVYSVTLPPPSTVSSENEMYKTLQGFTQLGISNSTMKDDKSLSDIANELAMIAGNLEARTGQSNSKFHSGSPSKQNEIYKHHLQIELEEITAQLAPLERRRHELERHSEKNCRLMTWTGLGLMGIQFGVLGRLTWWEYSWDIMEPVTYFVTYGTAMACYAYYVLTKNDYILPDISHRHFLNVFHKKADKSQPAFNINRYNQLKCRSQDIDLKLAMLRHFDNTTTTTTQKPKDHDGLANDGESLRSADDHSEYSNNRTAQ